MRSGSGRAAAIKRLLARCASACLAPSVRPHEGDTPGTTAFQIDFASYMVHSGLTGIA